MWVRARLWNRCESPLRLGFHNRAGRTAAAQSSPPELSPPLDSLRRHTGRSDGRGRRWAGGGAGPTEAAAGSTLKGAAAASREIKRAKVAAATGQVRDLRRALDAAEVAVRRLAAEVTDLRAGYDFDETSYLASGSADALTRSVTVTRYGSGSPAVIPY